ncbi:hypothetical protein ACJ2_35260 [Pantoea sp. QMID2]|nr:hypothetical protein ACJ3_14210 [Pantoea sp. QMID3]GME35120.1 hypothetical protein ACJ1_14130 [Pantoea sp. QMID1]GME59963.1 hypothetical protein ACJ4_35180 [Pantoea sp. QMID4]GME61497.1 hypothetical protein ACJ2_35260 [Pantoea sp. QMID2]
MMDSGEKSPLDVVITLGRFAGILRLRMKHGQIGKSLKPSLAARPAPSLARDAFLF